MKRYVYQSPEFGEVVHDPDGGIIARFDEPGPNGAGRWSTDDPADAAKVEKLVQDPEQHGHLARVSDEAPDLAAEDEQAAAIARAAEVNAAANAPKDEAVEAPPAEKVAPPPPAPAARPKERTVPPPAEKPAPPADEPVKGTPTADGDAK